ncbi:amino acid ABC transporter permease [Aquihabitans sp. G128]|uniref:amino acid ABC transporter permease n=1 Tax=Aquihabitans sp. G128 TaxID=2849779 RepID=UPI001C2236AF|nr:amino acid ABC transporter permease [Aquihabitans sp. G128]QXC60430.1 amino acid ABC transporter permease [Aquihabitans sp. G128]
MSSVLFDEPGPAAKRRNAVLTVLGAVLVLFIAFVAVSRLHASGQFEGRRWEWIEYEGIQRNLLRGLITTLKAFAIAAFLSIVLGLGLAVGRLSTRAWVRWPSTAVVTVFRALPVVVLMYFPYLGAKPLLDTSIPLLWCVVFGLTVYNGSVLAEIFRAGVVAVPKGQQEAASAIGLTRAQTLRIVLFPQAVRAMLPTIISQLVVVLKDTALGFVIGFQELLFEGQGITDESRFGRPIIPVAIVVGAVYVVLCSLLSLLATRIERRSGSAVRRRPGGFANGIPDADAAPLPSA